jgi:hypothetical protein
MQIARSLYVLGADLMVSGLLTNADQQRTEMLGEDLMVLWAWGFYGLQISKEHVCVYV